MTRIAEAATPPAPASDDPVLRIDTGAVARLTLNRPKTYNALSMATMTHLIGMLDELNETADIAAVVLDAKGPGFCAGHDLKEMRANPETSFREETFATCSRLMQRITTLRQPVIAQVHGIATAAGCQMVATCDLAIAAEDARFGTPGVNIGLFCSTPMVALSRAVSRKQAMEMLLTGEMITAGKAVEIGLLNRAVPADQLAAETAGLAELVASKSPLVLKTGKEAFYHQVEMDLAEAYAYCSRIMVENMAYRDAEEGISAFIEKRKPEWTGE